MLFEDREFRDQEVRLDYNQFIRCRFYNCNILYAGGGVPELRDSVFENCQWILEDAADRTRRLISAIAQDGAGGRELVLRQVLGLEHGPPKGVWPAESADRG